MDDLFVTSESELRLIALREDLRIAVQLIKNGLEIIARTSLVEDIYYSAFLLLAIGYEHILKDIICIGNHGKTGNFAVKLKKYRHNLNKMLETVITEYMTDPFFRNTEAGVACLKFVTEDKMLGRILEILSDFGETDRYYYLDVVTSDNPKEEWTNESAEQRWASFEMDVYKEYLGPNWKEEFAKQPPKEDPYKKIVPMLTMTLQQFNQALIGIFKQGHLAKDIGFLINELKELPIG